MDNFFTKTRILQIISLILNISTAVLVTYSIILFFTGDYFNSNMPVLGVDCFRYFTNLSNILCALTCVAVIPFNIMSIKSGKFEEPKWASVLKFIGTTAVTVTFLTVMLFLGPTQGYGIMFTGAVMNLHLICPLLAIVSYCVTELNNPLSFPELLYGVLPTVAYAAVYVPMVLVAKAWEDFYGFATVLPWYVSVTMMPAATFLFAIGLHYLQKLSINLLKQNQAI